MKRFLLICALFLSNAAFLWFVLGSWGTIFQPIWARLLLFVVVLSASVVLFKELSSNSDWWWLCVAASLFTAVIYQFFAGADSGLLRYFSTYPFSLGWSEASRYYYASLFFSQSLYGIDIPPSVLHPSRYLMQAVPFLLPHSSLWLHRFWQVLLFHGTMLVTALSLAWRLRRDTNKPRPGFLFVLFAFLFLFQGPIYYHLLVMVIFVLWTAKPSRFLRTLGVVLLASTWAGISRVNWLPMPGLLVAALYLLEIPITSRRIQDSIRYMLPPLAWVLLGTVTAYLGQTLYQLWSGNPPEYFGSSFSSSLLWYRLLPNTTYPLGILPSVLFVSLPLALIVVWRLRSSWRCYSPWRLLGLVSILGALFLGGLVVSVKIGGGSNLHNLDAYLVLLLLIGSYVYYQRFAADVLPVEQPKLERTGSEMSLLLFAVLIPVAYAVTSGGPLPVLDFKRAEQAIASLQKIVDQTDGEVLFIRERQLIMFNKLHNVSLVPEHELVFLMEMAMANNQSYLQIFHNDLKMRRYALIISDPFPTQYQGPHHQFGEENDAWVERVSLPVLCSYETVVELPAVNLVVLAPRDTIDCP